MAVCENGPVVSSKCELWPESEPKIGCSRPKLSTPRPQSHKFRGIVDGQPGSDPVRPQIRVEFLKMGRLSPQMRIHDLATGPNQCVASEMRREFQICKFGPKSTPRLTSETKVVYPPPPEGQITGVQSRGGKMEPRRPLN
jgi:hypothetical protein